MTWMVAVPSCPIRRRARRRARSEVSLRARPGAAERLTVLVHVAAPASVSSNERLPAFSSRGSRSLSSSWASGVDRSRAGAPDASLAALDLLHAAGSRCAAPPRAAAAGRARTSPRAGCDRRRGPKPSSRHGRARGRAGRRGGRGRGGRWRLFGGGGPGMWVWCKGGHLDPPCSTIYDSQRYIVLGRTSSRIETVASSATR